MLLHMRLEIKARHVLGTAHITYKSFVVEVDSPDVSCHVLVSLKGRTAVITSIVPEFTVSAYVVLIGTLVVVRLLAHLADKAALIGMNDQVIAVRLSRLESLVTVWTHELSLIGVHLHVALEVLLGGRLIHTLRALVASRSPMLEHAVYIEAYLLREHFATVITGVLPMPGGNAKVHVVEVLIKFLLSAERHAADITGVSLPYPASVTLLAPPPPL